MRDNKSDSRARSRPRYPKPPFVGVGGKIEDRVDEAQDPWIAIKEEHRKLREEEGCGFTYLWEALNQERFWRTRLHRLGVDGRDATRPRPIEGARQPQTDKEIGERNRAHNELVIWQTVTKAGWMVVIGAWALDQVVGGFRRSPGAGVGPQSIEDIYDWLPGPPELDTKLFEVLRDVWVEATAERLGCAMGQWGDEQAAYLIAGLLRTRLRLSGNIGTRIRKALAESAGDTSYPALNTQLLQELPGAVRIAWEKLGPSSRVNGLRTLVSRLIAQEEKDKTPREWQPAEFTDCEKKAAQTKALQKAKDAGLPPREYELVKFFAENPRATNREAAQHMKIAKGTVKSLRSRIKKTTGAA